MRDQLNKALNIQLDRIISALGPDFTFSSIDIGSESSFMKCRPPRDWSIYKEDMEEAKCRIMAYIARKLMASNAFSKITRFVITAVSEELRAFLKTAGPSRTTPGTLIFPGWTNPSDPPTQMMKFFRRVNELRMIIPKNTEYKEIIEEMLKVFKGKILSLEYRCDDPIFFDPFPSIEMKGKSPEIRSVECLSIERLYVPNNGTFRQFLAAFPRMKGLRLVDIQLNCDDPDDDFSDEGSDDDSDDDPDKWRDIFNDLREKKGLISIYFAGLPYGSCDPLPCEDFHRAINIKNHTIVTSPIRTSEVEDLDAFRALRDMLIEKRAKQRLKPDYWLSEICMIPGLLEVIEDEWEDETESSHMGYIEGPYDPQLLYEDEDSDEDDSDDDGVYGHYQEQANCHPQ